MRRVKSEKETVCRNCGYPVKTDRVFGWLHIKEKRVFCDWRGESGYALPLELGLFKSVQEKPYVENCL